MVIREDIAPRTRLGESLVEAGLITQAQLEEALSAQASIGRSRRIGQLLTDAGLITQDELARGIARHLGLPFVALDSVTVDPLALAEITSGIAHRYQILPLRVVGSEMFVVMADPTDVQALDDVRTLTGLRHFRVSVAAVDDVLEAIDVLYKDELGAESLLARIGDAADASVHSDARDERHSPFDPVVDPAAAPVVALINGILADAVRSRATDIHIEPQTSSVSVRYRVDGLMQEVMKVPKHVQAMVVSRLKILAGMDIAERRKPQAGRITLIVNDRELDTRASSIPTFNGEKFVLRLLRSGEQMSSLSELGLDENQLQQVMREVQKPQGMIVFTGPTGSGKTSSMYALLSQIKAPHRNIVTLEDPIEYQLEGVNQTQIDEKAGITFAAGLRTLLRQDPDVILVGEIRDSETAEIAVHAANTGHLVLTSLHTKDAGSAITRLTDLGIEPFVVSAALSMVIAQRLVRCVCPDCAESYEVPLEVRSQLRLTSEELEGAHPQMGRGCSECAYTGYRKRIGVFEVMSVTRRMKEHVDAHSGAAAAAQLTRLAGARTVREGALAKAMDGVTTFEEVLRTAGADDEPGTEVIDGAPSSHQESTSSQRPRLLVIDDDPASNASMERLFSDYDVIAATSAEDGLRRATLDRPDGILLDLNLPDASGTDVIKQLRSSVATSLIPVLMLTGTLDKSVETENLRAGVDDYVTKPINHANMRIRVEILMRRRNALTPSGRRRKPDLSPATEPSRLSEGASL